MSAAGLCQFFFSRSGFWTFIFVVVLVWTPVKGGLHLIGSSQPIVAAPGDDVVLPCRVDPEWDAVGKTVEWSRPDLRPSGPQKRVEYVFVYRFKKTDRDMMMDTYIQRTSLSQDGLRRGDVSLTIRNVSLQDHGRFRCFIPRLRIEAELLLVVDPNFVSTTTTESVHPRNLITPTPQQETVTNGRRSRMFLVLPIILFIISLSLLFIFSLKNISKTKFQQNPLRASALQFCCFAQEQTCVDVEKNSNCSVMETVETESISLRHIDETRFSIKQLSDCRNPTNFQINMRKCSGLIQQARLLAELCLCRAALGSCRTSSTIS